MNKAEFLTNPDVADFIAWLSKDLPTRSFNLKFPHSRFVPGGLDARATGIENVLKYYSWNTYWKDARSQSKISSDDWLSTKESLQKLSRWLQDSVAQENEEQTFLAANAVMNWGGVRGASNLLKRLYKNGHLISYLKNVRSLLAVDGPNNQKISDITLNNIEKFDSGLTKIHALLDGNGSPIYDTRVGAAIGLLYNLYREQRGPEKCKRALSFPWGPARGDQIRNPHDLGYQQSKQFYLNLKHHEWAQTQLQLGWLLNQLLKQNSELLKNEGTISDRTHALEAALFVIGYDLRCFGVIAENSKTKTKHHMNSTSYHGYVPTDHPFREVIQDFISQRRKHGQLSRQQYISCMSLKKKDGSDFKDSTKSSYATPLSRTEFNLFEADIESLNLLESAPQKWLIENFGNSDEQFDLPQERMHTCLIDAWLVGHLNKNYPTFKKSSLLIKAEFAETTKKIKSEGSEKSAASDALIKVGQHVGKYFGLLTNNKSCLPTEFFYQFFGNSMTELENSLSDAANAIKHND